MCSRKSLALILLIGACTTDRIQHGQPDGGSNIHPDATDNDADSPDVTSADAVGSDAEATDATSFACDLEGPPLIDIVSRVGQAQFYSFNLQNRGSSPCNLVSAQIVSVTTELGIMNPPAFPVAIPPSGGINFTVSYAPSAPGADSGLLRLFASAGSGVALEIPISATAGPMDAPSTVNVEFIVTNTGTVPAFLVTRGWFCNAFDLDVDTALGFQCICECASPGGPRPAALVLLQPNESHSFTWDGREMVPWIHVVDCEARGWVGVPPANEQMSSFLPAQLGQHSVTVAYELVAPNDCQPTAGNEYQCNGGFGGLPLPPAIAEICPGRQVTQSFNVDGSANITVAISIP